ncbi:MAG: lysophospholipid acyltransferase family protein, partial [Lentisphaeria bacterium]|nr:lysophospholipid acyltransferase family protein [Lentisphaeria bacterium]
PHGILDGLVLAAAVGSVRGDLRILATRELAHIPELHPLLFLVHTRPGQHTHEANARSLRQALGWLKEGGCLLVFPAGAIAKPMLYDGRPTVTDPHWQEAIGRFVLRAAVPVLPAFVSGRTSRRYQLAGMVCPPLRLVLQPREVMRQRGRPFAVRIGNPIAPRTLRPCGDPERVVRYLRFRTYLLAGGLPTASATALPPHGATPALEPIPGPGPRDPLVAEVRDLPPDCLLVDNGPRRVYVARAEQIPNVLYELGRLREITFRRAGEGTGRGLDLDPYDLDYLHLFVWDTENTQIVGAYRMGPTDVLLPKRGVAALYSANRFRPEPEFFAKVGPALELGRSFVQPSYQKQYSSLLLLWQGIGSYVARNPRYQTLFGMVSVSNDYLDSSRRIIAGVLPACFPNPELRHLVHPVNPPPTQPPRGTRPRDVARWGTGIEELNAWVADVEPELPGLPVLLRQYARMGAAFLAFNVDPTFANTLDGFIVVDLRKAPEKQLSRLFGAEVTARIRSPQNRASRNP